MLPTWLHTCHITSTVVHVNVSMSIKTLLVFCNIFSGESFQFSVKYVPLINIAVFFEFIVILCICNLNLKMSNICQTGLIFCI